MSKEVYYVTMTDKYMSGWGQADGLINKLIFICEGWEQVKAVMGNAEKREEMKYINYTGKKPYYSPSKYYPQIKTIKDYPHWYQDGYFLYNN